MRDNRKSRTRGARRGCCSEDTEYALKEASEAEMGPPGVAPGAGSGAGHVVETLASGRYIDWVGTPEVISLNERHGQVSFRTGSKENSV